MNDVDAQRKKSKESMKIKGLIASDIKINDDLMSSIARELCNDDSSNSNTMSN